MKDYIWKRGVFFLLLVMISGVTLLGGCKKKETKVSVSDTELLLSFDSYEEITKTGIRLGNQFGKSKINQNKTYITEGSGSWMVCPQGDYGLQDKYPYVQMQCLKSDYEEGFLKSDFFDFDKVMLDVYNDSDEELQIKWNFSVANPNNNYVDTEEKTYVLKPNAWTTCEYELTDEAYNCSFKLESVKYMKITFLTKKNSKTDAIPTFYLDNLRGHIAKEERVYKELQYDMTEGLGFENTTDQYVINGKDVSNVKRVSYEEIGITPANDSMGSYALMGTASGSVWPGFVVNYEKTYEKDKVLTFMMYVEVDSEEVKNREVYIESKKEALGTWDYVMQSSNKFNEWIEVKVILSADDDNDYFFVNLDNNNSGTSFISAGTDVKFYLDNIRITEKDVEVIENEDGSVLLLNPYNKSALSYTYKLSVKEGQNVIFDVDVEPGQHMAVWCFGEGFIEDERWEDEFFAQAFNPWTGKQTIRVQFPEDAKQFSIRLEFRDGKSDYTKNKVTISNVKVQDASKEYEKNADGSVTLLNPYNVKDLMYNVGLGAKKGQTFSFDIELPEGVKAAVWVLGDGKWDEYEFSATDNVTGKTKIASKITKNVSDIQIYLQYRDDAKDRTRYKAVIRNMKVTDNKEYEKNADGSVTLLNPYNMKDLTYNVGLGAKKGQTFSFDIELPKGVKAAVWVLGDGKWDEYEFSATDNVTGKTKIASKITKDVSDIQIYLQYRDDAKDRTGYKAVICNVKVSDNKEYEKNADGSVTLLNPYNMKDLMYNVGLGAKKGQTFSFDIELPKGVKAAVWVLGDGKWDEYEFSATDNVTGKTKIASKITKDVSDIQIYLQYRDDVKDRTGYKAVIRNVKVSDNKEYEKNADGSITLLNPYNMKDLTYNVGLGAKKDQTFSFDIELPKGVKAAVWVLGDGKWDEYEFSATDNVTGKTKITSKITKEVSDIQIYLQYKDDETERWEYETIISNMQVLDEESEPEIVENADGSVTLFNPYGKTDLKYNIGKKAEAGEIISFDVEFVSDAKGGVWILGEGDWSKEYYAENPISGQKTITAEIKDTVTDIQIYVGSLQEASDNTKYAVKISNLKITKVESADASKGLTFENEVDRNAISGSWEKPDIQRVKYTDIGVLPLKASQGEYTLQVNATNKIWPGISVNYGKNYKKDMMLSFMMYIQVDASATTDKWVRLEGKSNGTYDWIRQNNWGFNQWIEVKTILCADTTSSEFFVNFDDGTGSKSWFGDAEVKIYLDNIRISEADQEVIHNADGSVTLKNPYWEKTDFAYNIGKGAKEGDTLSFDIEFQGDAKGSIWILGDGDWNKQWKECPSLTGKQTITTTVWADVEDIQIYIGSFVQATDGSEYAVTISNVSISSNNRQMSRSRVGESTPVTWVRNVVRFLNLDELIRKMKFLV